MIVQTSLIRGIYGLSQLLCYGVLLYLYIKAKHNTEPGVVTVKEVLGYGETGDRDEKITVAEHDQRMVVKDIQRVRRERESDEKRWWLVIILDGKGALSDL